MYPIGTLYPSQNGGPSNTVYWMAKALVSEGVDVTCISTSLGIDEKDVKPDEWHDTDYGRVIYTKDKIHSFPLKWMFHSFKEIKKHDIIHLTSLFYFRSIVLSVICVLLKKKIVWSVRGTLEDSALRISPIKKKVVLWFLRKLKSKCVFHSTSPKESSNIIKHLGSSVKYIEISNYIEVPELILINSEKTKELLYIGRLHPIKAIDHILLALAKSEKFKLDETATLNIAGVGDDDYVDFLKSIIDRNQLSDKVNFLGQVEKLEKQALLAKSYFTILVSHSENFGNVILESLVQATPVIASTGCPWVELEQNNAGFWVENDVESLSKVIGEIMVMDEAKYKNYRKNALELSRKYNIDIGVNNWIKAYKSLI